MMSRYGRILRLENTRGAFSVRECGGNFVPREELLIDMRWAQPSLMAATRVGMRWLVVRAEIASSHQYRGVQGVKGFWPTSLMWKYGAADK